MQIFFEICKENNWRPGVCEFTTENKFWIVIILFRVDTSV